MSSTVFTAARRAMGKAAGDTQARASAVLCSLALALTAALVAAPAARAETSPPGPALTIPAATLDAALSCSADLAHPARTPVLLVHGTSSSPQESWSWGYQRALTAQGHPVCTIALPERAGVPLQQSAQYVVRAIRVMRATSGRPISTVGHSQGALYPLWAARFWPDIAADLDDVIGLGAPLDGTLQANLRCALGSCSGIAWQMRQGSAAIAALRRAPLPSGPSYTSIASLQDELSVPQPSTARMSGVTTRWLQDVCPLRATDHAGLLWDAVGFALVTDALDHPGTADPGRVSRVNCLKAAYDDADMIASVALLGTVAHFGLDYLTAPSVPAEPALPDYAITG